MRVRLTTRRFELGPEDRMALERAVSHLERQLGHVAPDAAEIELDLERHPRRDEYTGSVRLHLFGRALPAKRNAAPTARALLKRAFDDLEEQLARFKARLRREYAHERKRASHSPEAVRFQEQVLLAERVLLDRALAGDRAAFDTLVQAELRGLDAVVRQALARAGREPTDEAVQHVIGDVLAVAFRELARKPARWSLGGWLALIARREGEREARELAVAQSAERPES